MKNILLLLCLLCASSVYAQKIIVSGNLQDTVANIPLKNAVVMAVRLRDSALVSYTRTNDKGFFIQNQLPIDTFQILISHPRFSDKSFYVFGSADNNRFDFGKISLPPKSFMIKEMVIYAYKDPVYYKGDTLVYIADSFKVKPNAVVEDLLKKLPGIKVDSKGAITSQGKKVDQVLVDGDEFFGSDPTIATKNLGADAVASVQVYEKDNASGSSTDEKLQVMDLKLKEEAKKGYFGKLSAAGDFDKYSEGEVLVNRFNKKQKISVFGLSSNTPRSNFGFSDAFKYGVQDEVFGSSSSSEDGDQVFYMSNDDNEGVPKTLRSGFYFTDKLSNSTKVNANYSFNSLQLNTFSDTRTQYLLSDTTYSTSKQNFNKQDNDYHKLNFLVNQKIDSLTELEVGAKMKYNSSLSSAIDNNKFYTEEDSLFRTTSILNTSNGTNADWASNLKLTRKFKKKSRLLALNYNFNVIQNRSISSLSSLSSYELLTSPGDTIDQQIKYNNINYANTARLTYTEPLSLKAKLEFSYELKLNNAASNKSTFDLSNGNYEDFNPVLSSNFENKKMVNQVGTVFIYEVKKQRFSVGAYARNAELESKNKLNGSMVSKNYPNLLNNIGYIYKFSDNQRFKFNYETYSRQPDANQLQPIIDNSNPDHIRLGNPALRPTFGNSFDMSVNSYKPVSGQYLYASADMNYNIIDISNSTSYDSIGRIVTMPINVKGNKYSSLYFSGSFPFMDELFSISPSVNYNYSSNINYINAEKNITTKHSAELGLELSVEGDVIEADVSSDFTYTRPFTTLSNLSREPYFQQAYITSIDAKLPWKFQLETEAEYNIFSKRTEGYNINYVLWRVGLTKTFFKRENFILGIDANDLLNENIANKRTILDNTIVDSKTTVIGRYILFRATYKFNSKKEKETNDFDF